jgi:hypothetical protein
MPVTRHVERHFTSGEAVRDIVIGMSDGLTVPFALAAGLSGAVQSTSIVITAGLAEIAAGSIAMGLGGYLAARSDAEHYASERLREQTEVRQIPEAEAREVSDVFASYGVSAEDAAPVVSALRARPEAWVDFMMRFELGLEAPDPKRALVSAATIAGAYIAGGPLHRSPAHSEAPCRQRSSAASRPPRRSGLRARFPDRSAPEFRRRRAVARQLHHLATEGSRRKEQAMLYTIAVVLLVLWLLGLVSGYTIGAVIHLLLVIAIVLVLVQFISGRRVA